MNRCLPILGQVAKRLRPMRGLDAAAVEVIEEHPAERRHTGAVLTLPEDRALPTGADEGRSVAEEWQRVDGGAVTHQATIRYVLKDVLATPFGFFSGLDAFARYGPIRYRDLLTARIERREKGFFAAIPVAQRYFGHWVTDALTTRLLRRPDEDLYLPVNPGWPHARQYVELLGIDRVQADFVQFDTLSYCRDIGQNTGRAARLARLRAEVRAIAGDAGVAGVFLRRGRTGTDRVLLNEDALADALAARGFAITDTSDDLRGIWAAAGNAPVTVSMEGSHWMNVFLASREDAVHVIVNPADRFNNVAADYVNGTPGLMATTVAVKRDGGYVADIDKVLRLIEMGMARQRETRA
ncbi:hypothetical protein OCGS_2451 [Oceaniovalibus guishaninsula JLT2003]|uniref:Glycosyltransferase 61 catalytic domain-containing protein n=1 Tax=Oceaniovalibus guishaninsula JLT2003 TaxID=1231392 RepID=K2H6Z1_9RHOB|nr:glycosyltransferase 61 family protein [Oceaniovalibus guishaninsula]EKE43413.1 hypothetical protein OCGS_2451 [Oceaniovalibus guishaninsula JLT2003]